MLPEKNSLHFSFYFALKFLTSKTSLVTLKLHILKGKNILETELRKRKMAFNEVLTPEVIDKLIKDLKDIINYMDDIIKNDR